MTKVSDYALDTAVGQTLRGWGEQHNITRITRRVTPSESVTAGVYPIWSGMWNGANPDTQPLQRLHSVMAVRKRGCNVKGPN